MGQSRPRPTLYPRQLVVSVTDELGDRIERDAAERDDKSKSAAARRLLELGVLLADVLAGDARDGGAHHEQRVAEIFAQAQAVR